MRKTIAMLTFAFLATTLTASLATAGADAKKSAMHKHQDCKECCCGMKQANGTKKGVSKNMGAKKDDQNKKADKK